MPLIFASKDAGRPHVLLATEVVVDRYNAGATFTSLDLPPRTGKSSVIHLAALELREAGAPWSLAIAPWDLLPDQLTDPDRVADTLKRYCGRMPPWEVCVDRVQHIRSHRFYEREGGVLTLYAATLPLLYANLSMVLDAIEDSRERTGHRPLVALDEAHLTAGGDKANRWGGAVERMADAGAYVVMLTGTSIRSDGRPVPGFRVSFSEQWAEQERRIRSKRVDPETGRVSHFIDTYKSTSRDGRQVPDYGMTWQDAWANGFLNQVNIHWADAEVTVDGAKSKVSELPAEVANKILREIVEDDLMVAEACRLAAAKLHVWREVYGLPRTKMLVTTGADLDRDREDNYHPRNVRRVLDEALVARFGAAKARNIRIEIATTTLLDDGRPNAAKQKIAAFRGDKDAIAEVGEIDIIVVKTMGLVGMDVPELKVQVCLSTLRDGPMMLQERTRALTVWKEAEGRPSDLVLPFDKANQSIVEKMRSSGGVRETQTEHIDSEEVRPEAPEDKVVDFHSAFLAFVSDHNGEALACDDDDRRVAEIIRGKYEPARFLTDPMILSLYASGAFPVGEDDFAKAAEAIRDEPDVGVTRLSDQTGKLRGKFGKRARELTSQIVSPKVNLDAFRQTVRYLQQDAKKRAHVSVSVDSIDDPSVLNRLIAKIDEAFADLVERVHGKAS